MRFRYLLPCFRDNKAQGGVRRNGSKDLSRVSRHSVFVPEGKAGISGTAYRHFSAYLLFIEANEKGRLNEENKTAT